MNHCPQCEAELPAQARFCPTCGAALQAGPAEERSEKPPSAQAQLSDTGAIAQGESAVAAGERGAAVGGDVQGDVRIGETIHQIVQDDVVERQEITNIFVTGGSDALERIVRELVSAHDVDERAVQDPEKHTIPKQARRQITEVVAAQKEAEARGVPVTPQAACQLGLLAAAQGDYATAMDYFRQAVQEDPDYPDAFKMIVILQQMQAMVDLQRQNRGAAIDKLDEAGAALEHIPPSDPQAPALWYHIADAVVRVANASPNPADRNEYYQKAAGLLERAVQLGADNAMVYYGIGFTRRAVGNLDAAVAAYERAVELHPGYTLAYRDLALAYESKMQVDASRAGEWCRKALWAWQQVYQLAPNDPGFSANYAAISQRMAQLQQWGYSQGLFV